MMVGGNGECWCWFESGGDGDGADEGGAGLERACRVERAGELVKGGLTDV